MELEMMQSLIVYNIIAFNLKSLKKGLIHHPTRFLYETFYLRIYFCIKML